MNKNEDNSLKKIDKIKEINKDTKNTDKKENEGNILDKLFLKTKTKPYIYYLPLTEEQVKNKLEKRKKEINK
jgi:hypothetical protein